MTTVLSSIVGFSRMGPNRELKKRVEAFWKDAGPIGSDQSRQATAIFEKDINALQVQRWEKLKETGIDLVPSGDYSLYDHVLDTAFLFGAIPARYRDLEATTPTVRTYFAMARGLQEPGADVPALPMKKWFDTNYHYIVPELAADQKFSVAVNKPLQDFELAKRELNLVTKPVLVGPVTFLHFSHVVGDRAHSPRNLGLLPALLSEYACVIKSLVEAGAKYIQIDEPIFALSLGADAPAYLDAFRKAAKQLQEAASGANLIFATYFNSIVGAGNGGIISALPAGAGIHLDLVRGPDQLDTALTQLPAGCLLSLGLVDGRNVWLTPLQQATETIAKVVKQLGSPKRVLVGTSCSLLHVPFSLKAETEALQKDQKRSAAARAEQAKILSWLSFGLEKCTHVALLGRVATDGGQAADADAIAKNSALLADHAVSPVIHNADVKKRVADVEAAGVEKAFRPSPFAKRIVEQQRRLQLPLLPTTTIGSFPQSQAVRSARASNKSGKTSDADYKKFIDEETERCVRIQEKIGLDILVHGEFERNDMVEFFAELLNGYLVTANGWVQSYGSRCVKPAILYGDVSRKCPMTVEMSVYAQSLTKRPMKGMLTGPTTIAKWSFVRNDQSLHNTIFQLAMALRDEVEDLDKAGISCIQVDEPGFREGLPLDARQHAAYLKTAVQAFKISTGACRDETSIHTHMCYSEFEDIFTSIAELDADVLYIEAARSELSLLSCFDRFGYPLCVGPGLYDIHSPRVPSHAELKERLLEMAKYIPAERLYANPDCGLKTRGWPETNAALEVMVAVVAEVRKQLAK